jgi:hypothetical protein
LANEKKSRGAKLYDVSHHLSLARLLTQGTRHHTYIMSRRLLWRHPIPPTLAAANGSVEAEMWSRARDSSCWKRLLVGLSFIAVGRVGEPLAATSCCLAISRWCQSHFGSSWILACLPSFHHLSLMLLFDDAARVPWKDRLHVMVRSRYLSSM